MCTIKIIILSIIRVDVSCFHLNLISFFCSVFWWHYSRARHHMGSSDGESTTTWLCPSDVKWSFVYSLHIWNHRWPKGTMYVSDSLNKDEKLSKQFSTCFQKHRSHFVDIANEASSKIIQNMHTWQCDS